MRLRNLLATVRRTVGLASQPPHELLLPADRLQFFLERARFLACRTNSTFCLLALSVDEDQLGGEAVNVLAEVIHERLRITDDKGYLADGRIGVVLPETPVEGAHTVARDVESRFFERGGRLSYEVFVYPSDFDLDGKPIEEPAEDAGSVALPGVGVRAMESLFERPLPLWKRVIDLVAGTALLVVLSPLLIVAGLLVKASSPGPALFVQPRRGHGGRVFRMYKFRSMYHGADAAKHELRHQSEQDGPAFKLASDPRVTQIGRMLRRTSIDELPQLLNVLKGEMSLVGPRPLPVEEADECSTWQRRRLDVTPGLTCIWQVRARSSVTFAEWVRMDLEYVRDCSFWQDVKLLVLTIPSVLSRRGAS